MKCLFCKTLISLQNKCAHAHLGGGIFVRTPTETKVYFWSPAQAKVSFSRKAEAQSVNRDRTGNAVHSNFSQQEVIT